jgi:hypothetical protein
MNALDLLDPKKMAHIQHILHKRDEDGRNLYDNPPEPEDNYNPEYD